MTTTRNSSLLQRLEAGPVICAEGYVFELERRGYLQAGAFVPEVVLEHPEVVTQLHRDCVHAGSDVVEALTYYAHREKLRVIGREQDLEPINPRAGRGGRQAPARQQIFGRHVQARVPRNARAAEKSAKGLRGQAIRNHLGRARRIVVRPAVTGAGVRSSLGLQP